MAFSSYPHAAISPVIAGAVNAVSSAAKEPCIQQTLYTSSSIAIASAKLKYEFTISTDHWNSEIVAKAWALAPYNNGPPLFVYGASKSQAEQVIWQFVCEEKPSLIINAVLPNLKLGTLMSQKQNATTGTPVRNIYDKGDVSVADFFPP
ncbi:MAG: hypothetical protein Q9199_008146 [Rusavskia elegans]